MGKFGRNGNGDTIQAQPINLVTEEGVFTDKRCGSLDTVRLIEDGSLEVKMRDSSTVTVNGFAGEDFCFTDDCLSFTSSSQVRIA